MFDIPFVIIKNFEVDVVCIGILAFLFASMVNSEAKNYVAMLFGVDIKKDKKAFSFNPFLHFDVFALPAFFVSGIAWPKVSKIDFSQVKKKKYLFFINISGAFANILFANIISSIIYILGKISPVFIYDKTLNIMMIVNVVFFAANLLIPIPPFNLGAAIFDVFFYKYPKKIVSLVGIFVILLIFSIEFFQGVNIIGKHITDFALMSYNMVKPY